MPGANPKEEPQQSKSRQEKRESEVSPRAGTVEQKGYRESHTENQKMG